MKIHRKINCVIIVGALFCYLNSTSQNVGIGPTAFTPNDNAMLEIRSDKSGILIPRLTITQRNNMSFSTAAEGLLIYQTDNTPGFYFNSSTTTTPNWKMLMTGKSGWDVVGNAGTLNGTDFIGTTDNQSLDFRTNNIIHSRLTTKGQLEFLNTGRSVFIGESAGANDDLNGRTNTFIGYLSGYTNSDGYNNIFIGPKTGYYNTHGVGNYFVGYFAGMNNTTGNQNIFIGNGCGQANTTGSKNYFLGENTGYQNISSNFNFALGYNALGSQQTGQGNEDVENTAIGCFALASTNPTNGTNGRFNTAFGFKAGIDNTIGYENYFSGFEAGMSNTEGYQNFFEGFQAGNNNTTGIGNFFCGYEAGYNNTTKNFNHFVGYYAGYSNTDGNYNHFEGSFAGYKNTSGINNHFCGNSAGENNTTGKENFFEGFYAGRANISANANMAIGPYALLTQQSGQGDEEVNNMAIGYMSLYNTNPTNSSNGRYNIAIGYRAGRDNTTGYRNTYIGVNSALKGTTAYYNTTLGFESGYYITSGNSNCYIGYHAGALQTNTNNSTCVGAESGYTDSGHNNTFLGYQSGRNASGGNNVFIGYQSGMNETYSNKLYIENSNSSTPLIGGDFSSDKVGINRMPTTYTLEVGGTIWANGASISAGAFTWSDVRYKKNIVTIDSSLSKVCNMRGVYYDWKSDEFKDKNFPGGKQIGVIAQEVEKIYPELVTTDKDGYKTVSYEKITPILIEAIKEQQKLIESQQQKINTIETSNSDMEKRIEKLEKKKD